MRGAQRPAPASSPAAGAASGQPGFSSAVWGFLRAFVKAPAELGWEFESCKHPQSACGDEVAAPALIRRERSCRDLAFPTSAASASGFLLVPVSSKARAARGIVAWVKQAPWEAQGGAGEALGLLWGFAARLGLLLVFCFHCPAASTGTGL